MPTPAPLSALPRARLRPQAAHNAAAEVQECGHVRALPPIGECPYCTLGVPEPRPVLVALEHTDGAMWTQSGFDDEDAASAWAWDRIAQGDVARCSIGGVEVYSRAEEPALDWSDPAYPMILDFVSGSGRRA